MQNKYAKYKIVADSSSDVLELTDIPFESAPLKIITSNKEYVDNVELNVKEMVEDLLEYKGKSSSSCPNPNDWLKAFGDAEQIFCVTITSELSGSYNAACTAKKLYEDDYPDRKVFVINSLSTGPEMRLIIEKLQELIIENKSYEEICNAIANYQRKTGLLFFLESMKNLANNGRVSPIVAKAAGLLGIRVVGKASDQGTLEPLNKCRGENKALDVMIEHLKSLGYCGGKLHVAHCFNESAVQKPKEKILTEWKTARLNVYRCRGLCSFYAEKGGLLLGFERA